MFFLFSSPPPSPQLVLISQFWAVHSGSQYLDIILNGWLIIIYSIIFCFSFHTFSEVCFVPFPLLSFKTFGYFFYMVFHLYLRWNQGWIYRNQPTCYRHWECAWCLCIFFTCTFHRPYSCSRYWTGTSLQVRLMRRVFSYANGINFFLMIFPGMSLHYSSSPMPRRR